MQMSSPSSPLDWFRETQIGWQLQDGIPTWFHGAISREASESLLQKKAPGCFLVRVSQSHAGYTLSYRSRDCYRHFMIKPLPDGRLVIPGEKTIHSTLVELVNFYQKTPLKPPNELLTQPCSQENEDSADYEELFLYCDIEAGGKTRPTSTHMPKTFSFPSIPVSLRQQTLPWKRMTDMPKNDRPNSTSQTWAKSSEQSPTSNHAQKSGKTLIIDAPQKIWKNLKNLPQTGKKITEQIKSHIPEVELICPSSVVAERNGKDQARESPSLVGDKSATQVGNRGPEKETQNLPSNIYTDIFDPASLPKQSSHPTAQDLSQRKMIGESTTIISTFEETILPVHRRRLISSETTGQESLGPAENKWGLVPEEYRLPPPFAPGF